MPIAFGNMSILGLPANYHHRTARIYTDFSLLTSAPELTEEVAIVFNTLTGLAGYPGLKKLMVAPFDLSERLIKLIERETRPRPSGETGAHYCQTEFRR